MVPDEMAVSLPIYGNHHAYTTCSQTNGTQPSQTYYVMRKHLWYIIPH